MPEISKFLGINVAIYYLDKGPAHFRARYADQAAVCTIEAKPKVLRGKLPLRVTLMLLDWASRHESELMANWELAAAGKPLIPIEGSVL